MHALIDGLYFQRSIADDIDTEHVLIKDLKTLLDLKQKIETIKKDTNDPELDEKSRLKRVEELQIALSEVNSLKMSVDERMKESENDVNSGMY